MKLTDYLKDKNFSFLTIFLSTLLIIIILIVSDCPLLLVVTVPLLIVITYVINLLYDFIKRKTFYNNLLEILNKLKEKYLITEIIKKPDFIEGSYLIDFLYEIDKSYIENLNKYKYSYQEFKEYIELWCHEIKTPIATSKLIIDNTKNEDTKSVQEEIQKIEYFVEQVLFYARSETVDKDYIVTETNLKEIVNKVIKNNKKDLLNKKIKINTFKKDVFVKSDTKWIEFIINQIIINGIKYISDSPEIEITVKQNINNTILNIKDNGIGINLNELDKVFNKGFTGTNGRKTYNSTGIGLYLCKNLCNKLGIDITLTSKENKYTNVSLVFPINSMTNIIKEKGEKNV